MPDREDGGIIYYRSKADAVGSVAVGCLLLGIAIPALTLDSVGGIRFSEDLVVMSTYLGLPLGVVLVLANLRHLLTKGPTMVAGKLGITLLFTDPPAGPLRWAEIKSFKAFKRQGKRHLGMSFVNPELTLTPYQIGLARLVRRPGPKAMQLKIDGKMLDEDVKKIETELEEMRQIYSWRV